jgi:hypothetical protein
MCRIIRSPLCLSEQLYRYQELQILCLSHSFRLDVDHPTNRAGFVHHFGVYLWRLPKHREEDGTMGNDHRHSGEYYVQSAGASLLSLPCQLPHLVVVQQTVDLLAYPDEKSSAEKS